jgi:hypothetical protein
MKVVRASETSVSFNYTTWRHIPENSVLYEHNTSVEMEFLLLFVYVINPVCLVHRDKSFNCVCFVMLIPVMVCSAFVTEIG